MRATSEMAEDYKQGLVLLTKAGRMLAKVQNLGDATDLISIAQAAKIYARKAKLGLDAQNKAAEIKIRAERLAGEFIQKLERGQGKRRDLTLGNVAQSSPYEEALESACASRRDASRWQLMSKLPVESFEAEIQTAKSRGGELTTTRQVKAAAAHQAKAPKVGLSDDLIVESFGTRGILRGAKGLKKLIKSDIRFQTLYLDPPWSYDNQGTRAATDNHYNTMSVDEVSQLPVGELAAKRAHLHLWTTNAFLFDCKHLLETWGFDYKGIFVWTKTHFGIGNYWRVAQEFPRSEHSQKPSEIRELIEQVSPGPRLELFARKAAKNWVCWGDQVEIER